jgi:hypothetical protein
MPATWPVMKLRPARMPSGKTVAQRRPRSPQRGIAANRPFSEPFAVDSPGLAGRAAENGRIMKKVITLAIAVAALAIPAASLAGSSNNQASDSGATHGAFADVNGDFGWLGEAGGTPGYHEGAVGQEPGATGYNNSHVIGDPQTP